MKQIGLRFPYFFLIFCLVLVVHIISYTSAGIILSSVFFTIGLFLIPLRLSWSLFFFLLSIILFDDINKYDVDIPPLNGIYTVNIFGFSISLIWSFLLFFLLILYSIKGNWKIMVPLPIIIVVYFAFLGISRIYQFTNPTFISDIGFIINIMLGFLIGQFLLKSTDKIVNYIALIIFVFLSKYIIVTIDGVYSSLTGVIYTLKGESASNFIVLPIVLILLLLFNNRITLSKSAKMLVICSLLITSAYLLFTISRERILMSALVLIGYFLVYTRIKILLYAAFIFVFGIIGLAKFNPNMHNFVVWKLNSMMPYSEGKTNSSSTVRLLEFKNIWYEQKVSPHKLIIGTGWGGYFTSEHIDFDNKILGSTSYPMDWIENDTFFKPHGTFLYVMLKYGSLGLFLFYGSLILFSISNIFDKSIYHFENDKKNVGLWWLRYIQIAIAISLPIVCLVIFTSKLQILTGFFIAMLNQTKVLIFAMRRRAQ